MKRNSIFHRQLVLLFLYIAQSIPMSFFSSVVPVIMREEQFSLESIGMLQLIKFPWILKLFIAPFVDDKTSSLKDYKRWIIGSELFYAVVIAIISFFSLETDFILIFAMMVVAFIASATQDIATDALSIRILEKKKRSFGASMQSIGSFTGTLVGSGLLLMIYNYFGWKYLLAGLAGFVLLAMIPLIAYNKDLENDLPAGRRKPHIKPVELLNFFKQKGIMKQVGFLLLYYSGIITLLAMLRPYLVDLGYSKSEIGFLFGVLGTSTAALCSFASGMLVRKFGKKICRIFYACLIVLATSYVLWGSFGHTAPVYVYSGIMFIWATYGFSTVLVYTSAMDLVRPGREGTDFTIQTVLTHASGLLISVFSGLIAGKLSYSYLFAVGVSFSVISLIYNIFYFKEHSNAIESSR